MPPPRNLSQRSNSKIQPSHFPKRTTPMRAALPGRLSYPPKGLFLESWGKARRDRDAWTAWKQNCTAKHASSFFAHSLTATPYHLLPLWTGTSSRDSVKKRQGRFRDACPKAHCDTQKRPAARQDVSLREISAGGESALLPEPAADFQTGFFPDWPRSARPSARSPSDCSGRSGSRKSCRGRRPAQGRAP